MGTGPASPSQLPGQQTMGGAVSSAIHCFHGSGRGCSVARLLADRHAERDMEALLDKREQ